MPPEPFEIADRNYRSSVDRLARTLLALGADESVRVLEALAAALVNCAREPRHERDPALREPPAASFRDPATAANKLELCRRIARRALRGSLADPTPGATAFHRVEDHPAWARDLLPVASFGSYLFYQLAISE